ncbi:hypothetical protein DFJ73DRAFT_848991 [Zopfochytrium polystomum]|nr:hypothetical protein DFJ73DRAFT_848991 [Zopfochytrium polystomum]
MPFCLFFDILFLFLACCSADLCFLDFFFLFAIAALKPRISVGELIGGAETERPVCAAHRVSMSSWLVSLPVSLPRFQNLANESA